jgi:Cu(I)/Ag(I) efflux system protein CusF
VGIIPTMQELEHPVTFALTSLSTLTRRLGVLAAGLSMALAAQAQSVEGEVKKIDLDAGKVTLKHGEIKNLDMPAMQMAFRVSDPAWLKRLQVGDKVSFSADKVNGQFTVTAIDVKK